MTETRDPTLPEPRRRRVAPGLIAGVLLLLGLIVVASRFAEGEEFVAIARRARPWWLLLALVAQVGTYAAEAAVWRTALRRAGTDRPFRELYGLSLVALFTNQAVPTGGVAGALVTVRALRARGVPRPLAVAVLVTDLVAYYGAYALTVALALAILAVHHDLGPAVIAMAGALALGGVGVGVAARWLSEPSRSLPAWVARVKPLERAARGLAGADPSVVRDRGVLLRALLLRTGNFALDAFTLWTCLRAVGEAAPLGAAISAFATGSLARTLGIVPGGLGTFEAAAVGGLALFDVPFETALTAVLLFRGLSFWLPMLPGLWLGPRFVAPRAEEEP